MKYIDAEKLKTEIERRKNEYREFASERGYSCLGNSARIKAVEDEDEEILSIITSLQQEQPEVDIEKEIEEYCGDRNVRPVPDLMEQVARHFYELGRNARKEE